MTVTLVVSHVTPAHTATQGSPVGHPVWSVHPAPLVDAYRSVRAANSAGGNTHRPTHANVARTAPRRLIPYGLFGTTHCARNQGFGEGGREGGREEGGWEGRGVGAGIQCRSH
jgi:hypothetical protein